MLATNDAAGADRQGRTLEGSGPVATIDPSRLLKPSLSSPSLDLAPMMTSGNTMTREGSSKVQRHLTPLQLKPPTVTAAEQAAASVSPPVSMRRKRRAMMAAKLDTQALGSPVAPSAEPAFEKLVMEAAARVRLQFNEGQRAARASALRAHRVSAAW
eukprot:m.169357 g.169357  ORF g.169357 m.169357 type:complete len:157 (+) comp13090_c0_seq1:265-735(+)